MNSSILVTGANRGLGLEFVRQYAAAGFQVYAACRSPEKSAKLLKMQQTMSDYITVIPLDVCNPVQISNLAKTLNGLPLDILINNAGVYGQSDADLGKLDRQAWLDTFAINTIAPLKIIEALLDNLALGKHKKIISISSKMGSIADNQSGGSYVYRSSKAALNMAMKSVAVDTRDRGFISTVLHPGWVKTDMGGPGAEITVNESVSAMIAIIDKLTLNDSGQFIDIDGSLIPW